MNFDMKVGMIFLIALVIFSFIYVYVTQDDTKSVYNPNDKKTYQVRSSKLNLIKFNGNQSTDETAVEHLAELNRRVNILVNYMYTEELPSVFIAHRLKHRWSNCNLRETSSWDNSVAFTINKGREIRICIRDENGSFEDFNTSMFVILHELAHVMSESYGHNEEFNTNFSYIIHLASYLGLYKPENFVASPKTYCGFSIKTTPCDDGTCTTYSQ